jgi:50S ribosomal subunit-associated GTPase HflX
MVRKVLVANKIDVEDECNDDSCLEEPRKISKERGRALASKHGMDYYEVSAKSNEGVTEMFQDLATDINNSIQKAAEVKNEAEDMSLTITLNSKHARNIRKINKLGIEYKVEEGKSIISKFKERLCGC